MNFLSPLPNSTVLPNERNQYNTTVNFRVGNGSFSLLSKSLIIKYRRTNGQLIYEYKIRKCGIVKIIRETSLNSPYLQYISFDDNGIIFFDLNIEKN